MTYTLIGADGRPYESSTEHRVFFADEATAIAAGYRPCGACMRDAYRAWKQAAERG